MQLDEETQYLKIWLESQLLSLEIEMMEFPPNERNDEFDFLIKKAVNYRGLLERIKEIIEQ
jgi:hypothetical protein